MTLLRNLHPLFCSPSAMVMENGLSLPDLTLRSWGDGLPPLNGTH